PRNTKNPRPVAISWPIRARSSAIVASGNSSRRTGVSYALRSRKRRTAASISSSVAGDKRTIQSSVSTRSLPSQTDLPLGRYGGWNVIGVSSHHAGAACAASSSPPVCLASPIVRRPWPATVFDVAAACLSPVFLDILGREIPMVRWFAAFAFIFILSMVPPPGSNTAFGQDGYPTRPVKFLVPYPGGGTNDVLARIVGDKLQAKWGQPVIIENRSGGSGNIGAALVAQAEPDGYTLMVSATPPLATNQSLYKELSYKPEEFVPITNFGSV